MDVAALVTLLKAAPAPADPGDPAVDAAKQVSQLAADLAAALGAGKLEDAKSACDQVMALAEALSAHVALARQPPPSNDGQIPGQVQDDMRQNTAKAFYWPWSIGRL